MRLLILPCHRVLVLHSKLQLQLLPGSLVCQQYAYLPPRGEHSGLVALYHYKTVSVYPEEGLESIAKGQAVKPAMTETFLKKVEVLDLFTSAQGQPTCVLSDKFGDIYQLRLGSQAEHPLYMNSNLGIPKYIRHVGLQQKEYLVLGDEENRIKVYNALNIHQLISVWFLVNTYSVECHLLSTDQHSPDILVLLLKYYNKITLESRVHLHTFQASSGNLQSQEYPGQPVESALQKTIDFKQCRYFTSTSVQYNHSQCILLLYLFESRIQYQLFSLDAAQQLRSASTGQVEIEHGKWDYLSALDSGENGNIVIAYGVDVEMPAQLGLQDRAIIDLSNITSYSFNQYQKLVRIQLGS